jgi:hypothetical protein
MFKFFRPTSLVKNINKPECVKCKHFIQETNLVGRCSMFGNKDVVTGQIKYEYASVARMSLLTIRNCGVNGKYFVPITPFPSP